MRTYICFLLFLCFVTASITLIYAIHTKQSIKEKPDYSLYIGEVAWTNFYIDCQVHGKQKYAFHIEGKYFCFDCIEKFFSKLGRTGFGDAREIKPLEKLID